MNKLILGLMAGALSMGAMSCSQDESPKLPEGNSALGEFTLTCDLPAGLRSRGYDASGLFGDGKEATKLTYVIHQGEEVVIDSRTTPNAPEATYSNGTFSLKINLLRSATNPSEYGIFLWADAWGNDPESPFTIGNPLTGELMTDGEITPLVSINHEKAFGTFDKADAFMAYGHLCDADLSNKTTNFTLKRPFAQVCVVSSEFNDREAGAESDYKMHVVTTNSANNDYHLPGLIEWTNETVQNAYADVPLTKNIVPTDAKVKIGGRNMRYLYMGYIAPDDNGISLYFLGEKTPIPGITTLDPNKRYIIYPKDNTGTDPGDIDPDEPGPGFFTEGFEIGIIVAPAFDASNEFPVEGN